MPTPSSCESGPVMVEEEECVLSSSSPPEQQVQQQQPGRRRSSLTTAHSKEPLSLKHLGKAGPPRLPSSSLTSYQAHLTPFAPPPPTSTSNPALSRRKGNHSSGQSASRTANSKRSSFCKAKVDYQALVQQFVTQLTKGCGQHGCTNRFCASSPGYRLCLDASSALVLAMELARPNKAGRLCNSTSFGGLQQGNPPFGAPPRTKKEICSPDGTFTFLPLVLAAMWAKDPATLDRLPPLCDLDIHAAKHVLRTRPTTLLRALFRQPVHGIGSCFLKDDETDMEDLNRLYWQIFEGDPAWTPQICDHYAFLLERIHLNLADVPNDDDMRPIIDAWSRSIHCCARWLILQAHWPTQQNNADIHGNALMYKLVQVLSKTPGTPLEQPLINVLSRSSVDHMSEVVFFIQLYLMDHFHVGPYRRDRDDAVVAAVKALAFLYECNAQRVDRAEDEVFIHEELLGKLVIKDEYRIWKRVLAYGEGRPSALTLARVQQRRSHSDNGNMVVEDVLQDQQRRSRLFMTTNLTSILLPYPFVNSYQFSWLSYPFLLSAAVKRKVLLMDCMGSMSREYEHACVNHTLLAQAQRLLAGTQLAHMDHAHMKSAICPYLLLEIRRLHFVQDTWHQVSQKWADLKKPLKIKFVDGGEEGVDQGGVQKEFFAVLFEHLLAKQTGLFGLLTDDGEPSRLYWFRATPDPDIHGYEMLGVLLGLAIYNGVLLQLAFPRVLWQLLLQPDIRSLDELPLSMDDLRQAWPQLAQGLDALLAYDGDDVENVFCRNYERTIACFEHENDATSTMTVPLIEGGQWIAVTNANRQQYVADYARHVMLVQHRDAILALRRGLWCVLGCSALSLLTPSELERIACGWALGQHSVDLDMAELEAITEYDDGYHADHPVIRDFWSIVHVDMTAEQKHKLLLFVTASDRIPVGGLKELTFVIQRNGPDSDRLPTALTCFARLLLPEYASRDKLRDRLITSIENSKGFGLV